MDVPKLCLEKCTAMGKISCKSIVVLLWATENNSTDLDDRLKTYDAKFRHEYCNKFQLYVMNSINKFFTCPDHCIMPRSQLSFDAEGNMM